ncbi:MAG: hypothetical protein D6722_03110 [Bacteroidetes bacterium]|nr:MAG: hypothetical protein D6722_03110 [Bacteroidota bacterium]
MNLDQLINSFSPETLQAFLQREVTNFRPLPEDLTDLLHEREKGKFSQLSKLGEAEYEDVEELLVFTCHFSGELSERAAKKHQFELAKRVLKEEFKDGAIFVFYDGQGAFRFSFIRKYFGQKDRKYSNWKRYTYFVHPDRPNQTFRQRLSACSFQSLDEIQEAFSVEPLNKEFYQNIVRSFYGLVGGEVGKGKKREILEAQLQLPGGKSRARHQERQFAVRLIGRIIFCWFLKHKTSRQGQALIADHWLSPDNVSPNYYHGVLEPLFFEILNKPAKDRPKGLPEGHEAIPFLNGGLFEPQQGDDKDYYQPDNSNKANYALRIPDEWFKKLYQTLSQYNFTIDENSVNDAEVSIDPEMLGRIFENLLAEIDPDSGESARKATGSFYTPREIVDYMVVDSLTQFLHTQTQLDRDLLRELFDEDQPAEAAKDHRNQLLSLLSEIKILDPACGSGAFPMGVLHKLLVALRKLDPEASWWKEKQLSQISNALVRQQLKAKLDQASVEYARKLGVIQHSLYGVDIQPIAAEISKLRCFLSLVVDETIDDQQENRGVEPLPNLEFKFVTADSLLPLPEETDFGGIFHTNDELEELARIRDAYLQSYGPHKEELKQAFKDLQLRIYRTQSRRDPTGTSRAFLISAWNPFSHDKVDWFDPKWMFGVPGFHVVIGNPPYLRLQGIKATNPDFVPRAKKLYQSASKGNWDLYVLFTERGYELLAERGVLAYIQPHKFFQADFGIGIRNYLAKQKALLKIVDFGHEQVFSSATNYTCLLFLQPRAPKAFTYVDASDIRDWLAAPYAAEGFALPQPVKDQKWTFTNARTQRLLNCLRQQPQTLQDVTQKIFVGLQTSADKIYVLESLEETGELVRLYSRSLERQVEIERGLLKPFLMGKDVKRYEQPRAGSLVVFPYHLAEGQVELMTQEYLQAHFPKGWQYLIANREVLEAREGGKFSETWWQFSRPQNMLEFQHPKLMTRDLANGSEFTLDELSHYHTTTIYSFVFQARQKEAPAYWLGLLNSKLFWFFMQATGNVMRGGYFRFKTEYMRPFPVRSIQFGQAAERAQHDEVVGWVKQILAARADEAPTEGLEAQVDARFFHLYGFSEAEMLQLLQELPDIGEAERRRIQTAYRKLAQEHIPT